MDAQVTAEHVSTRYGTNQLKLRIVQNYTRREALRPYPHVTMVEGGLESGAA